MKIAVRDIVANPYRKIDNYPIDAAKVEALKESINQTGFWDNLVVREHPDNPGTYQLTYGHHRMEAVRQLGIETVDFPVRAIDDATMLRMMAQENMDIYQSSPRVVNETVLVAKEFIDAELAKYETWGEFTAAISSIGNAFPNGMVPKKYGQLRSEGAGRSIICAFLGGNWRPWKVEGALKLLNSEAVNREAAERFDNMKSAGAFAREVQRYAVPRDEQIVIAEKIIESEKTNHETMREEFPKYFAQRTKEIINREIEPEPRDPELEKLQKLIKEATNTTKKFTGELWQIVQLMESIGMQEVHAVEGLGLRNEMVTLFHAIKKIQPVIALEEFTYGNEDGN
jgi:ParB-like chromosome segregation protein Spo0J